MQRDTNCALSVNREPKWHSFAKGRHHWEADLSSWSQRFAAEGFASSGGKIPDGDRSGDQFVTATDADEEASAAVGDQRRHCSKAWYVHADHHVTLRVLHMYYIRNCAALCSSPV